MNHIANKEALGAADNMEVFGEETAEAREEREKHEKQLRDLQTRMAMDAARWAETLARKPPRK